MKQFWNLLLITFTAIITFIMLVVPCLTTLSDSKSVYFISTVTYLTIAECMALLLGLLFKVYIDLREVLTYILDRETDFTSTKKACYTYVAATSLLLCTIILVCIFGINNNINLYLFSALFSVVSTNAIYCTSKLFSK